MAGCRPSEAKSKGQPSKGVKTKSNKQCQDSVNKQTGNSHSTSLTAPKKVKQQNPATTVQTAVKGLSARGCRGSKT